ncbi:SDR family NAD(P)-dependent oxidoreductase [Longivirga aurantiaca]|uniref:SDR family NAD(P)-dependent oxidoreductase n=1 Tax=Longivirga aurantiaca TaxID=1837743 RepID=A0ABW1SXH6_9ACTN
MDRTVALVTGANRGVGRAFVEALLDRGTVKVYAAARDLDSLGPVVELDPGRVVPVHLDLLDPASISEAAVTASDVTLLVNNAGILRFGAGLEIERDEVLDHFLTNTMGTYDVIRSFVPALERNGGGQILVVMSLQSLGARPGATGYSVSKAALHSLCQSLRPALRERGIALSGVYPGAIDTDMLRGFDIPKTSARDVAEGALRGLDEGRADIFPDADGQLLGDIWRTDPLRLERLFTDTDELREFLTQARADRDAARS